MESKSQPELLLLQKWSWWIELKPLNFIDFSLGGSGTDLMDNCEFFIAQFEWFIFNRLDEVGPGVD